MPRKAAAGFSTTLERPIDWHVSTAPPIEGLDVVEEAATILIRSVSKRCRVITRDRETGAPLVPPISATRESLEETISLVSTIWSSQEMLIGFLRRGGIEESEAKRIIDNLVTDFRTLFQRWPEAIEEVDFERSVLQCSQSLYEFSQAIQTVRGLGRLETTNVVSPDESRLEPKRPESDKEVVNPISDKVLQALRTLLGSPLPKFLKILDDKGLTGEQKMRELCREDGRLKALKSPQWGDLLNVTSQAVRQYEYWIELRREYKTLD